MSAGRVALVTGAAQGMGRSFALALQPQAAVAVVDVDEGRAEETAEEIRGAGGTAEAFTADIADTSSVEAVFKACEDALGPVDILVNNAGIGSASRGFETTDEDWDRVHAVNLRAALLTCRAAVPGMMERGWGRVINISSAAAIRGNSVGDLAYASSKAGLIGFTRTLCRLVGSSGVTVNIIAPDCIATEMPIRGGRRTYEEWAALVEQMVPLGRPGQPEEVAALIAFLASDAGGFITGTTVAVAGGSLML